MLKNITKGTLSWRNLNGVSDIGDVRLDINNQNIIKYENYSLTNMNGLTSDNSANFSITNMNGVSKT